MTDEEKKRQGVVSQSVTQPQEQVGELQTEPQQVKSNSGTALGTRTSSGTILNYDPNTDANYQSAIAALTKVQQEAPAYTDSYGSDLAALYERIVNRPGFKYDVNGDPLYQMYKDQYLKGGNLAMRDTMGQASSLTGGYGSTYSQRQGQQAYDAYVQQLNAVIPELYGEAYNRWNNEGQELYNQYGLLNAQRADEYARYGDDYNRWMQRVQFARNDVDMAYERGVGDWQREYAATMNKADALAEGGDFSEYAKLYGQGAAATMFNTWKAQNPLLAYQNGYIDAEGYKSITGSYPPGYKAPSSGRYYAQKTEGNDIDSDFVDDAYRLLTQYSKGQVVEAIKDAYANDEINQATKDKALATVKNVGNWG